ncbi:hypothetical protein [Ideonella livida]|uniref:Uncharacterized protein n=1 Tax=Ideonella livida TaxID=2707176 RepID=A0A7C9PGS1_9BURK|nr:hypothetical protein [Ideonella livida]NDY91289.1 hypothetical protein [Ideonella livida]
MSPMATPLPGACHVYLNYWGHFGAEGYHSNAPLAQPAITVRLTLARRFVPP